MGLYNFENILFLTFQLETSGKVIVNLIQG